MAATLTSCAHAIMARPAEAKPRLVALDGLRGLLALIVALVHALDHAGLRALDPLGPGAVWGFFALSGCVLSRNWNGQWGAFLLRRVVRLWPAHLACLGLAWALNGTSIHPVDLLLFPWAISASSAVYVLHLANPPTWSLCIEVASIPFMPLIALCGRNGLPGLLAGLIAALLMALFVHPACLNLVFFMIGAAFSQARAMPMPALESHAPQFLGRISYSLYLVHGPIFLFAARLFGPTAPLMCLPLTLAASWLLWRLVEQPCVAALRRGKGRKVFFFEKKKQKTFVFGASASGQACATKTKILSDVSFSPGAISNLP